MNKSMHRKTILLLGCGYTSQRVARYFLAHGVHVIATTRTPARLTSLANAGAAIRRLDVLDHASLAQLRRDVPHDLFVLYSIPTVHDHAQRIDPTSAILEVLQDRISRLVYISTTGVYGSVHCVDETTAVAPCTERQVLRVAAERAIAAGPWSTAILRPAAIYGPGRGVHVAMQEGRYKLVGAGSNFNSRIHVDDLATHIQAALLSDVSGAYPVADQAPSSARDVASFCAALLNVPMPPSVSAQEVDETLRSDRRVNGGFIREVLGISLKFPSYRTGIPAALVAERNNPDVPEVVSDGV